MSQPARMAVKGAAAMVLISIPLAAVIAYYLGSAGAASFLYGVFVGLIAFASIGVAVSLIFGGATQLRVLIGAGVYVGRILFAAAAVLVPVFSGWLPALPMLGGLVLVYVVECIVLLVEAQRFMNRCVLPGLKTEADEEEAPEVSVIEIEAGRAERRIS